MGAQIAAHLANANVKPLLFELAAEGKDKNANVKKAIDGLAKLSPAPAASSARGGGVSALSMLLQARAMTRACSSLGGVASGLHRLQGR